MAGKKDNLNTTNSFTKGMNNDSEDIYSAESEWMYARNAITLSEKNDRGQIGNEPGTLGCARVNKLQTDDYVIIGAIHLDGQRWALFSCDESDPNNVKSEIGVFDANSCVYNTLVNDSCLNFSQKNLITGASKEMADCTWQIYWSDRRRNPDRTMNIDNIPWKQDCVKTNCDDDCDDEYCWDCQDTDELDCEKLRISPLLRYPCLRVSLDSGMGELLNGSYYVVARYLIKGQPIGSYSLPSNIQPVFSHENAGGAIRVDVEYMDDFYDEFELVIVGFVNAQTYARRVGVYDIGRKYIYIDQVNEATMLTVPIGDLAIQNEIIDSSDQISRNGDYLLRIGTQTRFDFNYQPLANDIVAKWQVIEYDKEYYRKGGTNTGYMGDENYVFFIRWVYENGQRTSSYVIPGRAPAPYDLQIVNNLDSLYYTANGETSERWKVYNTASITSLATSTLADGGVIIAEGMMGYHETTEVYPNNRPDIWGGLCGKHIRLHRFPANTIWDGSTHNTITNHYDPTNGSKIRIKGVKFENIQPPLDNNGNPIQGIVGYEILRGSREGNKTILSKGMLNNTRYYNKGGKKIHYQNYPYNDLSNDFSLSTVTTDSTIKGYTNPHLQPKPHNQYSKKVMTYHSPDNMFKRTFLSQKGIKIYGELEGNTEGSFVYPEDHPKAKLLNLFGFISAVIVGIGAGLLAMNGTKRVTHSAGRRFNLGTYYGMDGGTQVNKFGIQQITGSWVGAGSSGTINGGNSQPDLAMMTPADGVKNNLDKGHEQAKEDSEDLIGNTNSTGELDDALDKEQNNLTTPATSTTVLLDTSSWHDNDASGYIGPNSQVQQDLGSSYSWGTQSNSGPQNANIFQIISGITGNMSKVLMFASYTVMAADEVIKAIYALAPYRQYALQYQSHCWYNRFKVPQSENHLRELEYSSYIDSNKMHLPSSDTINNVFRSSTVVLETKEDVKDAVGDNSRVWLGRLNSETPSNKWYENPTQPVTRNSSCHYVALKQDLKAQYGQLHGINEIPISTCQEEFEGRTTGTGTLFGGDIFIGRYTEKNTFYYFYDWMHKQPDGTPYNYKMRNMLAYTTFGIDTNKYDMPEFLTGLNPISMLAAQTPFPDKKFTLDYDTSWSLTWSPISIPGQPKGFFTVKEAYFYLFNSGVRDFFVESELNIDLRDWGDAEYERHYDPYAYTSLSDIFNTRIIKSTNFYKYDYSLSYRKLFNNHISWSTIQPRNYNPLVAETCYVYRPKKIIYSLPHSIENKKDFWRAYLTNNYKEFPDDVTGVKSIGHSGAMILFKHDSPIVFQGVEQMKLESGTKLTIGDGELFMQPMQNITNSDMPYEFGSCQQSRAIANTPYGLYWVSENQGKVFRYNKNPEEISINGINAWLAKYLPINILKIYPEFELNDNPVIGVGVQMVFDNEYKILYISKKDYAIRDDLIRRLDYVGGNTFSNGVNRNIKLGDPDYFIDASWTISYNTLTQQWISYHDWHPQLLIPTKEHFISTMRDELWKHNDRCDLYCNYYRVDYPFEVGFIKALPGTVTTLRNIEYYLEVFTYGNNCYDRFHELDFNFDEAVIYNSEQCSGTLRLNLYAKNDIAENLRYPITHPSYIDILYSKEEQKYRFNQFWDITDDRGEFNPSAQRLIWNTPPNGYDKQLNQNNLNYNKRQIERKPFRHYKNIVILRRTVCGDKKFLVSLVNLKHQLSNR